MWKNLAGLKQLLVNTLFNNHPKIPPKKNSQVENDNLIKCENLDNLNFCNFNFTNSEFSNLSIQKTYFKSANLTNAVFNNVNLTGSDFTGAVLDNTKFINCVMTDVIIDKSKVKILNPNLN